MSKVNLYPLTDRRVSVTLGCDPEFFFVNGKGQVVGSEKVLPTEGLKFNNDNYGYFDGDNNKPIFIVDGVQAELNPGECTCRALLGNDVHACFLQLRKLLKKNKKANLKISFDPLVELSKKELDSLSDRSKVFGCAPSKNIYMNRNSARIKVDPAVYRKRSAGGHVHLGTDHRAVRTILKNTKTMVPLLDLIVGNTCVLIDRHDGNVERREVYGRAGEYRIKPYGLEYRTLSNFWMRSYQLFSFVLGLSRQTVEMVYQSTKENDYVTALLSAVPREDVIRAIQKNDFDLAYQNFKKIQPILEMITPVNESEKSGWYNQHWPLCSGNIKSFLFFVKMVKEKGLKYWFPQDPLTHWCCLGDGHGRGWESFLNGRVKKKLNAAKGNIEIIMAKVNKPKTNRRVNGLRVVAVEA